MGAFHAGLPKQGVRPGPRVPLGDPVAPWASVSPFLSVM